MVSFNDVNKTFKEHGCILIMSEEKFNEKTRKSHEKYQYIASCGHNHNVLFSTFKYKLQVICPKCSYLKDSINKIEKYRLNPVSNLDIEYDNIEYFKTIIGDKFDVKINGECCLADCCIKPKHITEDSWLMVQMKSTEKPTCKEYNFDCKPKYYINCIVMCICSSDKKMWLLEGNKITTTRISIGLTNSQYDEFEITKHTIHEKLTYYYNTFPKYDFETTDIYRLHQTQS